MNKQIKRAIMHTRLQSNMNAAVNRVAQGMAIRRPRAKVPCKRDKNNYANCMSVSKSCVFIFIS